MRFGMERLLQALGENAHGRRSGKLLTHLNVFKAFLFRKRRFISARRGNMGVSGTKSACQC
jgi:hypothetical protein